MYHGLPIKLDANDTYVKDKKLMINQESSAADLIGWLPIGSNQETPSKLKETLLNISDSSQCEADNNRVMKSSFFQNDVLNAKNILSAAETAKSKVINESLIDTLTGQITLATYFFANDLVNHNGSSLYSAMPKFKINDGQICAQSPASSESLTDVCQGDSGGPLFSEDSGSATLVGIVSYGPGCALSGAHGVYTKVKAYSDWINTTSKEANASKGSSSSKGGSFGFGIFSILISLLLFRRKTA